jgi:hypothetical protein
MSTIVVNPKAKRKHSAGANQDMERDIGVSQDVTGSQNIHSAIVITVLGGEAD